MEKHREKSIVNSGKAQYENVSLRVSESNEVHITSGDHVRQNTNPLGGQESTPGDHVMSLVRQKEKAQGEEKEESAG